MTELQIGLIGLGATAVVVVFGYNKWQEYRQRKLAEGLLRPQQEDVVLGDGPKAAPAVRNEKRNNIPQKENPNENGK